MARAEVAAQLKAKRQAARLKRQFNLGPGDYDRILRAQLGVCAVCQRPPKKGKRLAVDHDHETGLVRGLVDWRCNRLLGVARDNGALLASAAEFLRLPPATIALGEARYGRPGRVTNKSATTKRLRRRINWQLSCELPPRGKNAP